MHLGDDINILIAHEDFAVLEKAAEEIKETLQHYPGVGDIVDNYARGNRELKIRLKPEARTLGISEEDLGKTTQGCVLWRRSIEVAARAERGEGHGQVSGEGPEEPLGP